MKSTLDSGQALIVLDASDFEYLEKTFQFTKHAFQFGLNYLIFNWWIQQINQGIMNIIISRNITVYRLETLDCYMLRKKGLLFYHDSKGCVRSVMIIKCLNNKFTVCHMSYVMLFLQHTEKTFLESIIKAEEVDITVEPSQIITKNSVKFIF